MPCAWSCSSSSRPLVTTHTATNQAQLGERHRWLALFVEIVLAFDRVFATWRRRTLERYELARLTYRSLQGLGIGPTDVQRKVSKPFWRL